MNLDALLKKLTTRTARITVIGLGYVGLPLAIESARAGFKTIGIDVSKEKVDAVNRGENYIADIDSNLFDSVVKNGLLSATTDFSVLKDIDCISICVPTPLSKARDPDISFIISAVREIAKYLHRYQIVVLESTTYPGTTEEIVLPLLQESGLRIGEDFALAFSPERIDPGNKHFSLRTTPKVIGGVTPACTEIASAFYGALIDKIVPVRSSRSAEMIKLLENTFRAINIGLANEVALMCHHLKIDTWEVIQGAATKPFGFMPFYPGPGLGGHCIPIDPQYLSWKLKALGYHSKFIEVADQVNSSMPRFVFEKITYGLNERGKCLKGAKVLALGVAYKKNVADFRESPALDVIELLSSHGAEVAYHDPYVSEINLNHLHLRSLSWPAPLREFDCVVILTDHSFYNFGEIVPQCRLIVDSRNATQNIENFKENVIKI